MIQSSSGVLIGECSILVKSIDNKHQKTGRFQQQWQRPGRGGLDTFPRRRPALPNRKRTSEEIPRYASSWLVRDAR